MTRFLRVARRAALAIAWLAAAAVLALGGAGILAQMSHPPGTASRAELTWEGDRALTASLDAAANDLGSIAGRVADLSDLARDAITAVRDLDSGALTTAIDAGATTTDTIEGAIADLRLKLLAMPGDAPLAGLSLGAGPVGRRAAMLAAIDATATLHDDWAALTDRSVISIQLANLLTGHDTTVAAAAEQGRTSQYAAAVATLATATSQLSQAQAIRDRLKSTTDVSVLDEWLARNRRYDTALVGLYTALRDSGGVVNDAVRAAYKEEGAARAELPPDPRGLIIIAVDVAQGGLNQAVISIEQARGRLNLALESVGANGG